ncbi:hypothetical protein NQ314_010310, partial [Rhamnusium bicolor]
EPLVQDSSIHSYTRICESTPIYKVSNSCHAWFSRIVDGTHTSPRLQQHTIKTTAEQGTWASKQLQEALRNGEKVGQPSQCMKIYKYCPYTSQMMMTLLRIFGK